MHFHTLNYNLAIHAVDYTRDGRVRTQLQTGNSPLLSGNNLNRQWVSSPQPIDRGFCPLRPRKVNSTLLPRSTQGNPTTWCLRLYGFRPWHGSLPNTGAGDRSSVVSRLDVNRPASTAGVIPKIPVTSQLV